MNALEDGFGVALVFAEDLVSDFFKVYAGFFIPTTGGGKYRDPLKKHFNDDMLWVVYFFSQLPTDSCYETNYFPRGYNLLDFLHYCGKMAFNAVETSKNGISWAADYAVLSIASHLTQFILSGEFDRTGGWSELKEMSAKLCKWHVFCSVVCIGNKYVLSSEENVENPNSMLQIAAPEGS